ncbi:hypothetical protein RJ640_028472 [Escallonia rubra]|uniref:Retrovirus-related Pol polyprotein from transposon TNT 1-94-like beta-barrel domain-containing protein n=1 Tax=Escallonia rubra TaxID=112253 RepID=A0AA88QIR5_9ASTE|nr:hypothetical protein RJ640_028472 [Escallonia rubra]
MISEAYDHGEETIPLSNNTISQNESTNEETFGSNINHWELPKIKVGEIYKNSIFRTNPVLNAGIKEIGHIAKKCSEKKDKENGKKHVNNANVAREDDKSNDVDLYLVSLVEQQECNDVVCRVMGIGTIKIKMFEGIVRTLGDVRYIPDVKKILISLGTLDSIDYNISLKGRVNKVSKGAMVIMKG